MTEETEVHQSLGRLEGLMQGLSTQFNDIRGELRGGLNDAHRRMDKIEEGTTDRLNSHAQDIKVMRSDVDMVKGGVLWGKIVIPAIWGLVISLIGGIGWLLANSPAFTNVTSGG